MSTLILELRGTRTAEDVYKDTALLHGYSDTIDEQVVEEGLTQDALDAYVYPDSLVLGSETVESFTNEDGSMQYTVSYVKKVANPVSDIDFGKKLVQLEFAKRDAKLAGEAESRRAEIEYNI